MNHDVELFFDMCKKIKKATSYDLCLAAQFADALSPLFIEHNLHTFDSEQSIVLSSGIWRLKKGVVT